MKTFARAAALLLGRLPTGAGVATVEPMSPDRFKRLLHKYLGPEANWNRWFIDTVADIDHPNGRLIRLVPASIFTNNVSFFKTGPELAWPPKG